VLAADRQELSAYQLMMLAYLMIICGTTTEIIEIALFNKTNGVRAFLLILAIIKYHSRDDALKVVAYSITP
jgi:hypothetical protein